MGDMDAKAFQRVTMLRKPADVRMESLQVAVDFFIEDGRTQQRDVSSCIQLAGQIEESWVPRTEDPARDEDPRRRTCATHAGHQ